MKKLFIVALVFIFINNTFYAQVSTQLATITEGDPTNLSGLGYSFYGKKMSDGNLYFRGSGNGLRLAFWKTNGTVAGTSKVIEESNEFGSGWDDYAVTDEGVLININGEWSILKPGSSTLFPLVNLPGEDINSIEKASDGTYYITVKRDNNIVLFTTDASFSQVNEVGIFHPNMSFLVVTAGTAGAVIFSSNTFQADMPALFLKETNSIVPIGDFLKTIGLTVGELTYAYMHDRYLLLSYKDENNFFKNKVVDMISKVSNDFTYIYKPIDYFEHNNKLIIATEREIISLNPDGLTNKTLYSSVFSFTPFELVGDKLYFISRENSEENIQELDLVNDTAKKLEGAKTGSSFYVSKIAYFKNELYYIGQTDHQVLYKYDFNSNAPIIVDTLSKYTGATVEHALSEVDGNLVISKRYNNLQHELFVLGNGGITNVDELSSNSLNVIPSLATDLIRIDLESDQDLPVYIYTVFGQLVDKRSATSNKLNVSDLAPNKYIGIFEFKGKRYNFHFVKI